MHRWLEEWEIRQADYLRCIRHFDEYMREWAELRSYCTSSTSIDLGKRGICQQEITDVQRHGTVRKRFTICRRLWSPPRRKGAPRASRQCQEIAREHNVIYGMCLRTCTGFCKFNLNTTRIFTRTRSPVQPPQTNVYVWYPNWLVNHGS